MTPEQYAAIRQPLLDALADCRAQYDTNTAPLRAELVKLQEAFYTVRHSGPTAGGVILAKSVSHDLRNLDFSRMEARVMATLTPAELACAGPTAKPDFATHYGAGICPLCMGSPDECKHPL